MKRRKAFAREEKLQIIIGIFWAEYQAGRKDMTAAEVARKLDVTASTKLRELLNHLIRQGVLVTATEDHPGITGWRRLYALSPDYTEYAKAPMSRQRQGRELRINTRKGSFVEVLR